MEWAWDCVCEWNSKGALETGRMEAQSQKIALHIWWLVYLMGLFLPIALFSLPLLLFPHLHPGHSSIAHFILVSHIACITSHFCIAHITFFYFLFWTSSFYVFYNTFSVHLTFKKSFIYIQNIKSLEFRLIPWWIFWTHLWTGLINSLKLIHHLLSSLTSKSILSD